MQLQRKKNEYPLNEQCLAQDIVYKCIASTSMNPDKTCLRTAEGDLRKDTTFTQIHFDTIGTQKKQHYLSLFGKLKRGIMECQL